VRAKFRKVRKNKLISNKGKVLKGPTEKPLLRQLRKPTFTLQQSDTCCEDIMRGNRDFFLVMGHFRDGKLVPSYAMPWGKNSKVRDLHFSIKKLPSAKIIHSLGGFTF
jgi:hypothetical protein